MTALIHSTVVSLPDNPSYEVSKNAWNQAHPLPGNAGEVFYSDGAQGITTSADLTFVPDVSNGNTLTVTAAATQVNNLQEWRDSNGIALAAISPLVGQAYFSAVAADGNQPAGTMFGLTDTTGQYSGGTILGINVADPTSDPFPSLFAINVNLGGFSIFTVDNAANVVASGDAGGGVIDMVAYKVGGVAGLASFSGLPTSITVVNGIVTAAS